MVNRDLRDPALLGEKLFYELTQGWNKNGAAARLREIADYVPMDVPDYDANPSCIEKYGRPQDLPSTLPN